MNKSKSKIKRPLRPKQTQDAPGQEKLLRPQPLWEPVGNAAGSLVGKAAIITGGDSGIGRAIALLFAREGAHVTIVYLSEEEDAKTTCQAITDRGGSCLGIRADLAKPSECRRVIAKSLNWAKRVDILVNNAAEQHPQDEFEAIDFKDLRRTFETNVFAMFYLTQFALPHLSAGSTIINTTSVAAYRGSAHLVDYSASKGAIISFTRSLSMALVGRGIRVNAVAPGPVWTPLIPSTFKAEEVETFGSTVPMKRAGEPNEIAPSFLFLASEASSYMTGQVLHPNGGEIING